MARGTFQSAPYLMLKRIPEDGIPLVGNARFEGYAADLAEKIADIVGFDYLIRLVKDDKYGSEKGEGEGEWNGMVGELSRNVSVAGSCHGLRQRTACRES